MPPPTQMPLHFADTLLVNVAFPLPTSKARALLPPETPLNLVEVFPGRAVLVVSLALYRESPFGSYAEAGLALMATHEPARPVLTLARLIQESRYPACVLHMFVTSDDARRVGVDVWRLPRQMASVTCEDDGAQVHWTVEQDEQRIFQLSADKPPTNRARRMQIETYSQHEGALLHAVMHCEAGAYGRTQGGGASLHWGEHPIGARFEALHVSAQPLMVRYYDQMRAVLDAPVHQTGG